MDETVDPCENFFEFTCGNFLKTQRIQDDQNRISEFSILRDTASFSIAG
jgi:predicted metalloendopeptidase